MRTISELDSEKLRKFALFGLSIFVYLSLTHLDGLLVFKPLTI